MQFMFVTGATLLSILILFGLTRLIGYRQISQLSLYDYINSVTLGSIAAQLAVSTQWEEAAQNAVAMILYGIATWGVALLSDRSRKIRKWVVGHPVILMEKGKLYHENFSRVRLDLDEFESVCRASGYFDLSKIDTALMEPNGMISILPKSTDRPVTPSDLNLAPDQEAILANVIMDGIILEDNLRRAGYDRHWLEEQLRQAGVKKPQQVFLATCDQEGTLNIFLKLATKERQKHNAL